MLPSRGKMAESGSLRGSGTAKRHNHDLILFLLPAVIIVFVVNYVPMYGIIIAFKDFRIARGIVGSPWVGFKHFERFFNSAYGWPVVFNTLLLNLYILVIAFPAPIFLALLLNEVRNDKAKRFVQTVTYMPHFISIVVIVGMIKLFLSPQAGLYGGVVRAIGATPINLLAAQQWFRTIYVVSDVWQHMGWSSIIYLAALSAVDPNLYEAARVDGATRLQKIIHIDIPSLLPTIMILLILRVGVLMTIGFEKVFLMQNSLILDVAEVLPTYVYKVGIGRSQFSFATAVGLFQTLVNFVLLLATNQLAKSMKQTTLW